MSKTMNIMMEIDSIMSKEIVDEERKLRSIEPDKIMSYLRNLDNTITEDYIIRRFIMNNLADKILPEGFEFDINSTEAWPEDVTKKAAKNLRKLQKDNLIVDDKGEIVNIGWESFLVPSKDKDERKIIKYFDKHNYRGGTIYNIAFALGMDVNETAKLLCSWGGQSFNFHEPMSLAAYFCLSDKSLRNYVVYKDVKKKVEQIFEQTEIDYSQIDKDKSFFDGLFDSKFTSMVNTYSVGSLNNNEMTEITNDEKINRFIHDIKSNAIELKTYTASNTNRKLIKLILDDLKTVYKSYYFVKEPISERNEDFDEAGISENISFSRLMQTIQKCYLVKIEVEGKKKDKKGEKNTRGVQLDLPKSVENAINLLQTDLNSIERGFVRKKNGEENQVLRRDALMLVFFLVQEYIEKLVCLYDYMESNGKKLEIDEELPIPISLMSDFTPNGSQLLVNDIKYLAYRIYENDYEHDQDIIRMKMDVFIKVMNHYLTEMNFMEFYVPNDLDKFLLLLFMSDDPISTLGDITENYALEEVPVD